MTPKFGQCWNSVSLTSLTNTATQVSTAPVEVGFVYADNSNSSPIWLLFYSQAAAAVVVGTTKPVAAIVLNSTTAGPSPLPEPGLSFAGGFSVAAVTTISGSTAPGTALAGLVFFIR